MTTKIFNPVADAMARIRSQKADTTPTDVAQGVFDANVQHASVSAALHVESYDNCPKGCGRMTLGSLSSGAKAKFCPSCSTVMPLPLKD